MRTALSEKNLAEASMADHISFILRTFHFKLNLKNSVKPDTTQKLGIKFK